MSESGYLAVDSQNEAISTSCLVNNGDRPLDDCPAGYESLEKRTMAEWAEEGLRPAAIKMLKVAEGLETKLYEDTKGYCTIGFGKLVGGIGESCSFCFKESDDYNSLQSRDPQGAQEILQRLLDREAEYVNGVSEAQAEVLLEESLKEVIELVSQFKGRFLRSQFEATVLAAYNFNGFVDRFKNKEGKVIEFSRFRRAMTEHNLQAAYDDLWTGDSPFPTEQDPKDKVKEQNAKRRKVERGLFKRICRESDDDKYSTAIAKALTEDFARDKKSGKCRTPQK